MKKIKDRLNKKGFTLVELIVVIVIILILAAALVPNVMRYIGEARKSAFQSDASTYLVELQGYEAENFANYDTNLQSEHFTDGVNEKTHAGTTVSKKTYDLSGEKVETVTIIESTDGTAGTAYKAPDSSYSVPIVKAVVYDGAVLAFSYEEEQYYVNWLQETGWTDVTAK